MVGAEEHFRQMVGPALAQVLLDVLRESSGRARTLSAAEGFVEPRTEPTVAFDFSVSGLEEQLDALPDVRRTVLTESSLEWESPGLARVSRVTVRGQHLWLVGDAYALRVKRLDKGYRPSNYPTAQQERIRDQEPLPGLGAGVVYVTVGPAYLDDSGLPTQFVAVKHQPGASRNSPPEWLVDLEELASGGMAPATPVLPLPVPPVQPAEVSARGAVAEGSEADAGEQ